MAPSSGITRTATTNAVGSADDIAVHQQSNSALINARRNFSYLVNPTSTDRPARLRTRALLRTVRYVVQFVIWRLVRWAKYAAVGAVIAAIGTTALGTFVSGVGWVLAPPSIGASIVAMGIWTTGKFAARRFHNRWKETGKDAGEEQRERETDRPEPITTAGRGLGAETGPQAVPW